MHLASVGHTPASVNCSHPVSRKYSNSPASEAPSSAAPFVRNCALAKFPCTNSSAIPTSKKKLAR